uniref:Translation initiation factor eIF2 assembly protein n=1 Tax=Phallusia mammillata TaxID=59560 RepID=A0A6F9D887_9ASCI|nr:cell division cycle protein 123 homolog [Phallusia mammillata]
MKMDQIRNCRFSNWYLKFTELTMKSLVIPLSEEFVEYLKDNGTLVLPDGFSIDNNYDREEEDSDNNLSHWNEQVENQEEVVAPRFPDLLEHIMRCIQELGGKVFPKLTWSAPKDASWMTHNSLKCTNAGEVLLLLKSSDFVMHDLTSAFSACEDFNDQPFKEHQLVLRKWANLVPGMEFRCFVKNNCVHAISQRHCKQYYDYLERDKNDLAVDIRQFVERKIIGKFPDTNYVVDVYKKRDNRMWIIDFNPFNKTTDSLLFTWDELNSGVLQPNPYSVELQHADGHVTGQFRFTGSNSVLQPSETLSYRMPVDFVDLSTGSDATKLVDFMRMRTQNDEDTSESDDDEWRLPCDR